MSAHHDVPEQVPGHDAGADPARNAPRPGPRHRSLITAVVVAAAVALAGVAVVGGPGRTEPTIGPTTARLVATTTQATQTGAPAQGVTVESSTSKPSKKQWLSDVRATLRKSHARAYLAKRAHSGKKRLAINFDIDNTVNQTAYGGGPMPPMTKLIRYARGLGYGILFNTGRQNRIRKATLRLLAHDHFHVDGLCMRLPDEKLVHSKQRCRTRYRHAGWTLVENIGNNPTDLQGGGYGLGIMLPNYGGRLS